MSERDLVALPTLLAEPAIEGVMAVEQQQHGTGHMGKEETSDILSAREARPEAGPQPAVLPKPVGCKSPVLEPTFAFLMDSSVASAGPDLGDDQPEAVPASSKDQLPPSQSPPPAMSGMLPLLIAATSPMAAAATCTSEPATRGHLLSSIAAGVALRPVPLPDARPPHEREPLDVASELQRRFTRRRQQVAAEAIHELDPANRQQVEEFVDSIPPERGLRLWHMRELLSQAARVLALPQVTAPVLVEFWRWPADRIAGWQRVLAFAETMEACTTGVASLAVSATGSGKVNTDHVVSLVQQWLHQLPATTSTLWDDDLHQADVAAFTTAALDQILLLVDYLFRRGSVLSDGLEEPGLRSFDRAQLATVAYRTLTRYQLLCHQVGDALSIPGLSSSQDFTDAKNTCSRLLVSYQQEIQVRERTGVWDTAETVVLGRKARGTYKVPSSQPLLLQAVTETIASGSAERIATSLSECQAVGVDLAAHQVAFIRAALAMEVADIGVLASTLDAVHAVLPLSRTLEARSAMWLCEAAAKGALRCVHHLVSVLGLDVNSQSKTGARPLHYAARRTDYAMLAALVRLGANPLVVDPFNK